MSNLEAKEKMCSKLLYLVDGINVCICWGIVALLVEISSIRVLLHRVCVASRYCIANTRDCTQHCKTTLEYPPDTDLMLWHASASSICITIQLVHIFHVILQLLHLVSSGFSRYFLYFSFLLGNLKVFKLSLWSRMNSEAYNLTHH